MITQEQETHINAIGSQLSGKMLGFFGKIVYNIKDGKYINANIEQSVIPKPETQEKK